MSQSSSDDAPEKPSETSEYPPPPPVTSFVLGLSSVFLSVLTGLPAIITGHQSLRAIRDGRLPDRRSGLAKAGIAMGWLSVVALLVAGVILAIFGSAIFSMAKSVSGAKQKTSVALMEQLQSAIHSYHDTQDRPLIAPSGVALSDATMMEPLVAGQYFSAPTAKQHTVTQYAAGLSHDADGAQLWDAWGSHFRVELRGGEIAIWSAGPDRKDGTGDDVILGMPVTR